VTPPDPAYAQADRLIREAEAAARKLAENVPPRGWEVPHEAREKAAGAFPDIAPLFALVESARGAVPAELAQQLADALRELLMALRALIDWYVERLDRPATEPTEVEDIPID
jgi:hypothetical protein